MNLNIKNLMKFFRLDGPVDGPIKFLSIEDGGRYADDQHLKKETIKYFRDLGELNGVLQGFYAKSWDLGEKDGDPIALVSQFLPPRDRGKKYLDERLKSKFDRRNCILALSINAKNLGIEIDPSSSLNDLTQTDYINYMRDFYQVSDGCNLKLRPLGRPSEKYWPKDWTELFGGLSNSEYKRMCFDPQRMDLLKRILRIVFFEGNTKAIVCVGNFEQWKSPLKDILSINSWDANSVDFDSMNY